CCVGRFGPSRDNAASRSYRFPRPAKYAGVAAREETAEMADRTARSIHRLRGESGQRPHLTLIAGALDSATPARSAPLVPPAVVPPMLSPSSDICGVSRGGWAAA